MSLGDEILAVRRSIRPVKSHPNVAKNATFGWGTLGLIGVRKQLLGTDTDHRPPLPAILFPHVSHSDQRAAGADRGGRQRVRRGYHRSAELGTFLPALLRRAWSRFHAGDGAG